VLISRSGTTEEITKLIPYLPMDKELRLGLLGNVQSPLAKACGIVLDCSYKKEACLNNQAPTTSTAVAMSMGDALAVVYEKVVGVTEGSFASNHPGGILGKSLTMKVKDLMWGVADCPTLGSDALLKDVILGMTQKPVGGLAVVNQHKNLLGILVEGDIRRTFTKKNQGLETKVSDIMNRKPVTVGPNDLAYAALEKMEKRKTQISILPVVDEENRFLGFIRLHDLLKEGFFLNGRPFEN
jgi:arabinose-5-phosphate isomerase